MTELATKSLGIDVGGPRNGYDLVLLDNQRHVLEFERRTTASRLSELIHKWEPDVVAIDSPQAWAIDKERETERLMRSLGINLYQTPWLEEKKSHPFYEWMLMGFQAFQAAVGSGYRLFDGGKSVDGYCLEIFPYACAVVLSGALRPSDMSKHTWRRGVLQDQAVDDRLLRGADQVDAALAALTGVLALEGCFCWRGDPSEGVIVLPCTESALAPKYGYRLSGTATSMRLRPTIHDVRSGALRESLFVPRRGKYPDNKSRDLSKAEKAQIRRRIEQGDVDSFQLAKDFNCAVVQVAGIKAAGTLAKRAMSAHSTRVSGDRTAT